MLKLINKLLNKNTPFNYTIAQYQPLRVNQLKVDVVVDNLQERREIDHDEMQIDHLYEQV